MAITFYARARRRHRQVAGGKDLAPTAMRISSRRSGKLLHDPPRRRRGGVSFAANSQSRYGLDAIPPEGHDPRMSARSRSSGIRPLCTTRDHAMERPAAIRDDAVDRGHRAGGPKHAASGTKAKSWSVAGGDTGRVNKAGVAGAFTYVSNAGGAFLNGWRGNPCRCRVV